MRRLGVGVAMVASLLLGVSSPAEACRPMPTHKGAAACSKIDGSHGHHHGRRGR